MFTKPCSSSQHSTKKLIDKVCNSEDVQFYWLISSADFEIEDSEVHEHLIGEVAELCLTVRGFACSSMWNEKYIQTLTSNFHTISSFSTNKHHFLFLLNSFCFLTLPFHSFKYGRNSSVSHCNSLKFTAIFIIKYLQTIIISFCIWALKGFLLSFPRIKILHIYAIKEAIHYPYKSNSFTHFLSTGLL